MLKSIKFKLLALSMFPVLLTVLIISIVTINLIENKSQNTIKDFEQVILNEKKDLLKNEVLTVTSIVEDIIKKSPSKEIAKQKAKEILSSARYLNGSGYFFAYENKGTDYYFAFHGTKPQLNGKKTNINKPDIKGFAFRKALIDSKNDNNKFVEYYYQKPKTDKLIKKIAFSKYIPEFNWTIVTGIYIDDIAKKVQVMEDKTIETYNSLVYTLVGITFFVLVILCIIIPIISKISIIEPIKTLEKGLIEFLMFINGKKDDTSLIKVTTKDEIGKLTSEINENIKTIRVNLKQNNEVLKNVSNVVDSVARGDLSQKISASTSDETINHLIEGLNTMINSLHNLSTHTLEVLKSYENKNFTKRANIDCEAHFEELMLGVNSLGKEISALLKDNLENGQTLYSNSKELNENVNKLSKASSEQAASLEETAASLEEITETMRDNSKSMNSLLSNANDLESSVQNGKDLSNKTSKSMQEINEQVGLINEAIKVVDQIAFQTNILSLNAAVEAATAGEAGKGFAVVAQEVRNLANRASNAASEIQNLVEKATSKANEGDEIASLMYTGYEKLNENILETTQIINTVSSSSKEQMAGVEQINNAVSLLDQVTQENSLVALKTKEIANQTSNMASSLVEETSKNKF
ncbi:methyl-accepting chemotaxis protein [Arcobacter roscoffensis]|uniref:Methyl-accepting chemotaxis protein n=1 Tax=Arcobacter roscoffensis TaxID=2961520 RepID=A0ABY5E5G1_9BACT|nr:methyl-accepting chemotaxis protein [Arcobacter roscoffensis]UTJ06415.1 methyl-accepting chemotaxis protein [Arcobacter roscoffensis]